MIYEPNPGGGYEWIQTVDLEGDAMLASFDGTPRLLNWTPIKVRSITEDEGEVFDLADLPWLAAYALGMRRRAVEALQDILLPYGEILPLQSDDGTEFFTLNVTNIVDVLDESRADIARHSDGRILEIRRFAFKATAATAGDVFRLPIICTPTFLSQRFVDMVRAKELVGLRFEPVRPEWRRR